jgi:hypothetical protein
MGDTIPTVGRIVHYVLPHGRSAGQHRPAIIVRVWGEDQVAVGALPESALGTVQLQVFTDQDNDEMPQVLWATSAMHNEERLFGTWHWPEVVNSA